jgi:hypothetical protein
MIGQSHWQAVSTPPPRRTRFYVVGPDGQKSRPYKTAAAAKAQLKRYPAGSTIVED